MNNENYSLSFTTGAALIWESIELARLKSDQEAWDAVKAHVLENNTFQSRTDSTLKKLYGEVSRRLQCLSDDELALLGSGNDSEQKQLVWLALCRRYKLIKDFSVEVLSHYYDTARYAITHEDYDAFFNAKAEWHSNLDGSSSQTKTKARQVLFKMMKECGLVNDNNEIVAQYLSPELQDLIHSNNREDFAVFPGVEC
jgi:hypothetical protein